MTTVRELVGDEAIARNYVGKPEQPEWNAELTAEEIELLADNAYLDRIEEEHKELMAYMLFRQGSSIYPPEKLADRAKVPLTHVFVFYGRRGNARTGTY